MPAPSADLPRARKSFATRLRCRATPDAARATYAFLLRSMIASMPPSLAMPARYDFADACRHAAALTLMLFALRCQLPARRLIWLRRRYAFRAML